MADRKTRTATAVSRDVVVTDANCMLPALELPLLSLARMVADNEHEHVTLEAVKDTVVHTSVATFRVLDEPATIRPHVGATTNHGQVCVYVYATGPPLQTVFKTVPSGQVLGLISVFVTPMLHVTVQAEAAAAAAPFA